MRDRGGPVWPIFTSPTLRSLKGGWPCCLRNQIRAGGPDFTAFETQNELMGGVRFGGEMAVAQASPGAGVPYRRNTRLKKKKKVPKGENMRVPGFTAESSIYPTAQTYRAAFSTFVEGAGRVLPQARPFVCTECVWNTFDFGVPTCAKLCRHVAPPGGPQPEEFPVECDPSECPPRNCCPPGCVQC